MYTVLVTDRQSVSAKQELNFCIIGTKFQILKFSQCVNNILNV